MTVVALGTQGAPSKIFVFQTGDATHEDQFVCVASPAQLDELELTPKRKEDNIPMYLADRVTFNLRFPEELERAWGVIQKDAQMLISSLAAMSTLDVADEVNLTT